jgi:hypothetical protein
MNDKFVMEVTINPLVSPLVYERLSQCVSARERAAVLRSLAEATLRRELMRHLPISHPDPVSPVPASAKTPSLPRDEANVIEGFEILPAGNAADLTQGFSSDLGRQLTAYFD